MSHHAHDHPMSHLLPQLVDLDAEVHAELLDQALTLVTEAVDDRTAVGRVLDVGAGTGTGAVALARRFASAEVVAVDVSDEMLRRVRARVVEQGLAGRVATLVADVGSAAPGLGTADVVWSSMALHEVSDPDAALGHLFSALVPGGVLAVVEMAAPSMLLPERLAAFEHRVRAAAGSTPATDHPDWSEAIVAAGFDLLSRRTLGVDSVLAADGPAGELAALELRRVGHAATDVLDGTDRELLAALTGDGSGGVRHLGDLRVRGSRTLWLARRP